MHVTTVNKKTSNLKESKKKYMGHLEGGKGREKCCYYTIGSKRKEKIEKKDNSGSINSE